jgi:type 1 fimbriae regulatory protein FimB
MQGRLRMKDHPVAIVTSLEEEQRALDELLANLKALYRERRSDEWMFTSERGTQMAPDSFASQLKVAADRIGMQNDHPHALRHACGHALAVKGRETRLLGEWLGHRNLNNTALYTTASAPGSAACGIEAAICVRGLDIG